MGMAFCNKSQWNESQVELLQIKLLENLKIEWGFSIFFFYASKYILALLTFESSPLPLDRLFIFTDSIQLSFLCIFYGFATFLILPYTWESWRDSASLMACEFCLDNCCLECFKGKSKGNRKNKKGINRLWL